MTRVGGFTCHRKASAGSEPGSIQNFASLIMKAADWALEVGLLGMQRCVRILKQASSLIHLCPEVTVLPMVVVVQECAQLLNQGFEPDSNSATRAIGYRQGMEALQQWRRDPASLTPASMVTPRLLNCTPRCRSSSDTDQCIQNHQMGGRLALTAPLC